MRPIPLVRVADIEIDPEQREAFISAVKEEMDESVRVEPGVLALYAVAEKDDPCRLRFFEIYADEAAYDGHLEVAPFSQVPGNHRADDPIAQVDRDSSDPTQLEDGSAAAGRTCMKRRLSPVSGDGRLPGLWSGHDHPADGRQPPRGRRP